MPARYQEGGNDLDNVLAAYVSGDPMAPATGYQRAGSDLNTRYSKLSRGSAPATTRYEVAGADFNTIFAAKGTVLEALTLIPQGSASSTLSTASAMNTSSPAGSVTANTAVDTNGTGWSEMYGLFHSGAWASAGSIGSPDGNGWLWDSTILEGTSIGAGTWTASTVIQGLSSSDPSGPSFVIFIIDAELRAWKRSSGGVYTLIGSSTVSKSVTNDGAIFPVTNWSFSASAVSFGTGDKLYFDVWFDITTNLTSSPFASSMQLVYSSGGSELTEVVTPGFVIA